MRKYTSDEAIKRRAAGLTDRLAPQEFIALCQQNEGEFMTVDLSGSELSGVSVKDCATLYGSNLSRTNLSKASLRRCTLNDTVLTGANLSEADLTESHFSDADLHQANLSGASLGGAVLTRANLQDAVLAAANLEGADLQEADLRRTNLKGARLSGTDFRWADLSAADLTGVDLSEANLRGATMPDGLRSGTVIEAEAPSLDQARAQLKRQIPEDCLIVAEKVISDGQPVTHSRQTVAVEAPSVQEARSKAKAQLSSEFEVLSEKITSGAQRETAKGTAESTAAAFQIAERSIPGDATILERKEVKAPQRAVIVVEVADETAARSDAQTQARQLLGSSAQLDDVKMIKAGSKGFLGLGAKPNQYKVEISSPAMVEVSFQPVVKLTCELGIVDRPLARVTARITTIEQELELLHEAVTRGAMTGRPLLRKGMEMATNVLLQSPASRFEAMEPFMMSDIMIRAALDEMISSGDYSTAVSTLDAYHSFLSTLASQVKGKRDALELIELCGGLLGQTLASRYGTIAQQTGSIEAGEKGVKCADQGFALVPDEGNTRNASRIHRFVAALYGDKHNWQKAITHAQRAVEIDPEYDNAWWLLSKAYAEVRDSRKSMDCCMRAASLGHEEAREMVAEMMFFMAQQGRR